MGDDRPLSSMDPEPPTGTVVRDVEGYLWRRFDPDHGSRRSWMPLNQHWEPENDDTESWTRVAGNFGPVVIVARHPSLPSFMEVKHG